jgi:hypothetical protein
VEPPDATFSNPAGAATAGAAAYVRALLELLGDRDPVAVLERLPEDLAAAVAGLDDAALRRPEREGKWSVVEVVQHLADSEIVYGYRARLIVAEDRPAIPGYDQDAWARRLRYRQVALADALEQLGVLRRANLRWLATLGPEERRRAGVHAERGVESVEQIVRLLAAHDLVHLRQIARIRRALGA